MRATQTSRYQTGLGAYVQALALVAMLLQVVFYADHVGASAAKSFGNVSPDARLGLLEICTGAGVVRINADGTPVTGESDCPICENAAMVGFGEPTAAAHPPFVFVAIAWELFVPDSLAVADQRFPGSKPIRGPPALA